MLEKLNKLSLRWAKRSSAHPHSVFGGLNFFAWGLVFLGLYFFGSTQHPWLLGIGVYSLVLGLWSFERAGMVSLIRQLREDDENSPPTTSRQRPGSKEEI